MKNLIKNLIKRSYIDSPFTTGLITFFIGLILFCWAAKNLGMVNPKQVEQTPQVEQTISDYDQDAYIMCKIAIEDSLTVSYKHLNIYAKNMVVISNGDRSNSRVAFSMKVKVNGDMRTTRASCKLNQLNVTQINLV